MNLVSGTHHLTHAQVGVQFGVLGAQVLQGLLADSSLQSFGCGAIGYNCRQRHWLQSFGRGAIGYNREAAHKAN